MKKIDVMVFSLAALLCVSLATVEISAQVATPQAICPWDVDVNGIVNETDKEFVQNHFGCIVGAGNVTCDRCDVDGNGFVNPGDRGHISANLGTSCVVEELPSPAILSSSDSTQGKKSPAKLTPLQTLLNKFVKVKAKILN